MYRIELSRKDFSEQTIGEEKFLNNSVYECSYAHT